MKDLNPKKNVEPTLKKTTETKDNTKYLVEREVNGEWVPAEKFITESFLPLAKGRAACVFFTQWMVMHDKKFTLDKLREVFPLTINKYYQNSKREFFDTLIFEIEVGVVTGKGKREIINKAGLRIEEDSLNGDFYPVEPRRILVKEFGYGYLEDGNIAVMPKMWRKDDFQRLLEHIDNHPELFNGIRIRQA